MKNSTVTIESETKRRTDLVNDENFRIKCSKIAKDIGISAEEWNSNRVVICLMLANQFCEIENRKN